MFNILGHMSASGYPQNVSSYDKEAVSGGSGGFVLIDKVIKDPSINTTSVFSNRINVNGGQGVNEGQGGSGGRMVFSHNESEISLMSNGDSLGGYNPRYTTS